MDTATVIVNEVTLVGSRCGRFEPALKLLSQGRINVGDMISGETYLANAGAAFGTAAQKGVLKMLLRA
jgi:threonine dehydrogenase-like Zn-dependent dehydrogenase